MSELKAGQRYIDPATGNTMVALSDEQQARVELMLAERARDGARTGLEGLAVNADRRPAVLADIRAKIADRQALIVSLGDDPNYIEERRQARRALADFQAGLESMLAEEPKTTAELKACRAQLADCERRLTDAQRNLTRIAGSQLTIGDAQRNATPRPSARRTGGST